MNEITTIIFSKNRACQLELLLRNLNMPAIVLYAYDAEFKTGYEKLIKLYPSIKFIEEYNFKQQTLENLGEYTMFLCDDDIMIEHFDEDCSEFIEFKRNSDILCLSLRMSPNYDNAPLLKNNTWEWRKCKKDWGYPMSVTSHIFRKKDILQTMINGEFKIPLDLERTLKRNIPDRQLMMYFDNPKIINNLANQVQIKCPDRNLGISLVELEKKFLSHKQLSLIYIKEEARKSKSCFLMTDYKWEDSQLSNYKKNITSQRGEDGILEKIFEILEVKDGWCVDVGAYGKMNSNVYNLIKKGWSGVLIEKDKERFKELKDMYIQDNVYCLCKNVEVEGIRSLNSLLDETVIPREFNFLNIDIDGLDYYVWESLKYYNPLVVVVEFNSTFSFDYYLQSINGKGGASLSAMVKLGKEKGYKLIATTNFNAFFIRCDLFDKFDINDNSIEKLFIKNKDLYGNKTRVDIESKIKPVVLTANLGNFENTVEYVKQSIDYDFHRFTDENFPPRHCSMTPRLQARIPKMFGWQMIKGHEYYIWLDSSCVFADEDSISWLLRQCKNNVDMAVFKHPNRNSIQEEADYLKLRLKNKCTYITSRYENELINEQLEIIKDDKKYVDNQLFASTCIVYKNNEKVQNMMKEWWFFSSRYHSIDQLSFPYVIWKAELDIKIIQDSYLKTPYLQYVRNKICQ